MTTRKIRFAAMVTAGLLGLTEPALAFLSGEPTGAALSLNKCQRQTTKAIEKLAKAQAKAFRACADGATNDFFTKTDISDSTTGKCIKSLRLVSDSRNLGKSATEKANGQILKACAPGIGSNVHTLDDLLGGELAQVESPLDAKKLESISKPLGGPPTIDSVEDYAEAVIKIATVKTEESLGKTVPNGPQFLQRVKEKVGLMAPPPADPNLLTDIESKLVQLQKRLDVNLNGQLDAEPPTVGAACTSNSDCLTNSCVGGVCTCADHLFTFTVNSDVGTLFSSAKWPGGTETQSVAPGLCDVTIARPNNNIDLVCGLAAPFKVVTFTGYSNCSGTGGEDGDGCAPVSCPPLGIGSCCSTRPSCSIGINGSAQAKYFVQCVQ